MKFEEILTSFDFVNDRSYVHSSTIIENICKHVEPFFQKERDYPVLMDIQFKQELKSNAKIVIFEKSQDISKIKNLSVDCKIYSEKLTLYIYLLEEKKSDVIFNTSLDYSIKEIKIDGNYSGSCVISGQSSIRLISNIIEANKLIHKLTYAKNEKLKIINLYMKKFPVNILRKNLTEVKILISNLNISNYHRNDATLNKIDLVDVSAQGFEIAFLVKKLGNV